MGAQGDLFAHHYPDEGYDQMKIQVYRRVAWHRYAIAHITQLDATIVVTN